MGDDLPPRRHPADPPWWHWEYVNVRAWARTRRRGRFVFGLIAGAAFFALQLAFRLLDLRQGYAPPRLGEILFGGIFFGAFITLFLWSWIDRRYLQALARRAEYDADRSGREDEEVAGG